MNTAIDTANNTLSQLIKPVEQITKAKIDETATDIVDYAEENGFDQVETLLFATYLQKLAESIKSKVKNDAMDLVMQTGEKGKMQVNGVDFEVVETGVRYDYTHDTVHNDLKGKLNERIKLLKSIPDNYEENPVYCGETAEMLKPPVRKSTTTAKVTIPKK